MAIARESTLRLCPAGCGAHVYPGRLLCLECWWLVPREERTAVSQTWRDYNRQLRAQTSSRAMLAATAAYRRASDKAIAHARKTRENGR